MELFRRSRTWVIDYLHRGRARRRFQILEAGADAERFALDDLRERYADEARLVSVRPATPDEERDYLRGEEPRNVYCPTGARAVDAPASPRRRSRPAEQQAEQGDD